MYLWVTGKRMDFGSVGEFHWIPILSWFLQRISLNYSSRQLFGLRAMSVTFLLKIVGAIFFLEGESVGVVSNTIPDELTNISGWVHFVLERSVCSEECMECEECSDKWHVLGRSVKNCMRNLWNARNVETCYQLCVCKCHGMEIIYAVDSHWSMVSCACLSLADEISCAHLWLFVHDTMDWCI